MHTSLANKFFFSKPETAPGSRSQSSLSTISTKAVMVGKPHKHDLTLLTNQDFLNLQKSKSDLESKILRQISQMKSLKNASKSLRSKESELSLLQSTLIKSNEVLLDNRNRLETSKKALKELLKYIPGKSDQKTLELYQYVSNLLLKMKKKKKHSVTIEDFFISSEPSRLQHNSIREVKMRSPYNCSSFLNSPKHKKIVPPSKPSLKAESKPEPPSSNKITLEDLCTRLKSLLEQKTQSINNF